MPDIKLVEHTGYIEATFSDHVQVRIISESACASCHSKDACTASDMKEKSIDAFTNGVEGLEPGKRVVIQGQKSLGLKAALLAYILPFILVLITLSISYFLTQHEGIAGISALAILVPYFVVIKYLTPKLKKTFVFTIKEIID